MDSVAKTNASAAMKNSTVSLSPNERYRVGERSCLAALSILSSSGDEGGEPHVLHRSEGTCR